MLVRSKLPLLPQMLCDPRQGGREKYRLGLVGVKKVDCLVREGSERRRGGGASRKGELTLFLNVCAWRYLRYAMSIEGGRKKNVWGPQSRMGSPSLPQQHNSPSTYAPRTGEMPAYAGEVISARWPSLSMPHDDSCNLILHGTRV